MEFGIQSAKKTWNDVEFIDLEAASTNSIALNIYKKMGFLEIARIPKKMKFDKNYIDSIIMRRELK